jgi:predicted amidohydrolase YtcJ
MPLGGLALASNTIVLKGRILAPDCTEAKEGCLVVKNNLICEVKIGKADSQILRSADLYFDFDNKLIMPGFHDSHVHILHGALSEEGALLGAAKTEEEAVELLYKTISGKEYNNHWILGGAWDHFKWPDFRLPSKQSLDRCFPDRPVFLLNKECHGAWVNSKALAFFHINKETPDPENGKIFRDESGEPTGYLHESAALALISNIYDVSDFKCLDLTKKFLKRAASLGVTSVSDLQIYDMMKYHAYEELEKKDELTVRIHFCPPWTEKADKLFYLRKMYDSEKLRFGGVKGFIDGTPMGYTGLLIEAYGDRPGFYGKAVIEPESFTALIEKLDKADMRCRLHACGDGAVRLALNAFENARMKNGTKDIRHTIEHIEVIRPEDLNRFASLGVLASVQPDHMPKYDFDRHPFHSILGEERMKFAWPFSSLEQHGCAIAFGTDYPIAPLNPMRGLFRAITRRTDDAYPKDGWNVHEKMRRASSLRAYTYGGAYLNAREQELGTLEAGKMADIVVMDRNLLKCGEDEIMNAEVLMTLMDGKIIYAKEDVHCK